MYMYNILIQCIPFPTLNFIFSFHVPLNPNCSFTSLCKSFFKLQKLLRKFKLNSIESAHLMWNIKNFFMLQGWHVSFNKEFNWHKPLMDQRVVFLWKFLMKNFTLKIFLYEDLLCMMKTIP